MSDQSQHEREALLRVQLADAHRLQKKPLQEETQDDWLITYADAITLVLGFFVLILSVSVISQAKFEEVQDALNENLLNKEVVVNPLHDLESVLSEVLVKHEINPLEALSVNDNDLSLSLPGEILFSSASADFGGDSEQLLVDIAVVLKGFSLPNYAIEIEGHSDDVPIFTERFPSNWELSSARAISVLKLFLREEVDKNRLKAIGYADSRPKQPNRAEDGSPIVENRQINRRVEIKVRRQFEGQ